jgi:hypothetical protein
MGLVWMPTQDHPSPIEASGRCGYENQGVTRPPDRTTTWERDPKAAPAHRVVRVVGELPFGKIGSARRLAFQIMPSRPACQCAFQKKEKILSPIHWVTFGNSQFSAARNPLELRRALASGSVWSITCL